MNQRLVKSIAQIISAMSDEERQLLASEVQFAEDLSRANEPGEDRRLRVTEATKDTEALEKKSQNGHLATEQQAVAEGEGLAVGEPMDDSSLKNSFLRLAQSLQLEGPEDFSANIDHYLYSLSKQDG